MPKALSDTLTVAWMEWLRMKTIFWIVSIILLLWPLSMLFFARHLVPEGVEVGPRLIAGSIVFTLGLSTVNNTAQNVVFSRFANQLKIMVASPVHPYAWAAGSLLIRVLQAMAFSLVLLLFAPVFGIDIQLSLWFLPVALLTALSMVGLGLVIGTWSPNQMIGNQLSQVIGILIVIVSPIYFSVSRLPDWLEPIARLSPYTYAANALDAILSGRGGFYGDLAVLAAITAAGLVIGLAGMRWREV
jgi:ABC-type multidrug transport system permease subunit